jgi:hypothetical protein
VGYPNSGTLREANHFGWLDIRSVNLTEARLTYGLISLTAFCIPLYSYGICFNSPEARLYFHMFSLGPDHILAPNAPMFEIAIRLSTRDVRLL